MLAAWEEHLAHPALPRTLGRRLADVGLSRQRIQRHSIIEGSGDLTGYAALLLGAISGFAAGRRGVTEEEAQDWRAEQEALRLSGEFHLSIGQYFFCAQAG